MKKIIITTLLLFIILTVGIKTSFFVQAATSSDTPTTEPTKEVTTEPTKKAEQDVQELKDRVANKVSELMKKDNKAFSGFVTEKTVNQFKIKDSQDEIFTVKIDESYNKYFQITGNTKKEIKLENIEKDDYVIISGIEQNKTIEANAIFVDEKYLSDSGQITKIDKEAYSLTITLSSKETITIDVETSTKQRMLNIKTLESEVSGFSKIKEGDTVHFVIKKTSNEKQTSFSAVKLLVIPQEYFIK